MPDRLTDQLLSTRQQILDSISQPELGVVSARAGRLATSTGLLTGTPELRGWTSP